MLSLLYSLSILFSIIFTSQCSGSVAEYKIKPMKLGVEAFGINLQNHANDSALFEKIKEDVYRHRLVLFRNQGQLPAETFMSMFQGFGDAFRKPFTTQGKGKETHEKSIAPAIMRISNDRGEGYKGLGTTGWHIDGAYKPMPFSFLVFNSIKASRAGDTKFVGHREIISSLKQDMLQKLDRFWTAITRNVLGEKVYEIHPMIHTHPVVNESVLCLHLGYMRGVIFDYGSENQRHLSHSELFRLKGEMSHEIKKDNERLIYSHKWMEGDLVIIDNLQIAHMASKESQLPKEKVGLRILHRLAINGTQKPAKNGPAQFCTAYAKTY